MTTVVAASVIIVVVFLSCMKWVDHGIRQMQLPSEARYEIASWDAPAIYNMGCDDWYHSARVNVCTFGNKQGDHTAVLLGDSVGAQWFPAIRKVFHRPGWRMMVITKSACPMVDKPIYYPRIKRMYENCSIWRKRALKKIKSTKPDVVILGSTYTYAYTRAQWISGTREVLARISPFAKHVYVLRSTPVLPFNGPNCLADRGWLHKFLEGSRNCVAPAYNRKSNQVYRWQERAARHFDNVSLVDMTGRICPDAHCHAELNGLIVFRDNQHLTATFVKSLNGSLAKYLGGAPRNPSASGSG